MNMKDFIKAVQSQNKVVVLPVPILAWMYKQGIDSLEKYKKFFDYSINDVPSISEYKDGEKAKSRIMEAVDKKEKILIYGDYDADGITSTSIMKLMFKELGVDVSYYINDRKEEGFGIKASRASELLKENYDLYITVDNGISGKEACDLITKSGKDIVVTDHHLPDDDGILPNAYAVLDAKRNDEVARFTDMCGAGLSFMLMLDVFCTIKGISKVEALSNETVRYCISLAGLGTVTDVMPLKDYNRWLVKMSLSLVNQGRAGNIWKMILEPHKADDNVDELKVKSPVTETDYGFTIGPLLNSCQRMERDAMEAVRMFTAESIEEAEKHLYKLREFNKLRKVNTDDSFKMVENALSLENPSDSAIILDGEYSEGIIGLLAGKVCEKYHRPTIIFGRTENGLYKGSARSKKEYGIHIKQALDQCKDLFVEYGGHESAAGITIERKNLVLFRKRFMEICKNADKTNVVEDDVDIKLLNSQFDIEFIKGLEVLAPFGEGFRKPTIGVAGTITSHSSMKNKKNEAEPYLRINLDYGNASFVKFSGNAFNTFETDVKTWNKDAMVDDKPAAIIVGEPSINEFAGRVSAQMFIKEWKPWNYHLQGITIKDNGSRISLMKKA